jgi:hypothetical protein
VLRHKSEFMTSSSSSSSKIVKYANLPILVPARMVQIAYVLDRIQLFVYTHAVPQYPACPVIAHCLNMSGMGKCVFSSVDNHYTDHHQAIAHAAEVESRPPGGAMQWCKIQHPGSLFQAGSRTAKQKQCSYAKYQNHGTSPSRNKGKSGWVCTL